ncbi:AAA family ATPase [Pseudolabrys sp. Root1462]|uniref:ATP-dependent nuclease n=1 Tax=Pseudolabrys sp. Root1462 TaxID=1736466 RepID=UPI0009EA0C79|nr:AAA family ATPase [Pseudolabrys sp. Root1462]
MSDYLPRVMSLQSSAVFFGGQKVPLILHTGLTILVGPNGAGKTALLKLARDHLKHQAPNMHPRHTVYLSAGRVSAFENFRSNSAGPGHLSGNPAAIGHQQWRNLWSEIEGAPGMFLRLKDRPDLLLKVEARLQALYQRRLRLEWAQSGLQVGFTPISGGEFYYANAEASGLIQLIPLLAAIYDDGIGALLIDEPEISLHPQLQAFVLQEMEAFAGDPADISKKLIIIATHSPTMLPVRRIKDIPRLVLFTDRHTAPIQIASDAGEIKSEKLSALITRLSDNHKLAFFARNVLLVEGPSDEIVVNGLSLKLDHPLLRSNTQIVPVIGKGQFAETVKLFRLLGKNVFVLADLDSLADDNQLVNVFQDAGRPAATKHGLASLTEMDKHIRENFNAMLDRSFEALPAARTHRYWTYRHRDGSEEELKAKRRATLAALLSAPESELASLLDDKLSALRRRYDALLSVLTSAGCVILRRGTVEDYYYRAAVGSLGKPEAAANEMEDVATVAAKDVCEKYDDIVRALEISAPFAKVDENELLREQLGSLLGSALQIVRPDMADDELNARAAANFSSSSPVFAFTNRSTSNGPSSLARKVEVRITSPLFQRPGFPFEISDQENLTSIISQKLPNP